MLFARFLAENDLLIEPVSGVSVSLEEVEELAREQKVNRWELASRYAQRMLPEIFRPDDPVLAVALPTETRLELESLLESLTPAVFTAADSLGWVYQFWQSAEKDAVNDRVKSGEKITGKTLPAVTQLFTEHYMVLFLLHNTIGAWYAGKVLAARPELATTATSEQKLRDAVRLAAQEGYEFEYLRFVRKPQDGDEDDNPTGPWCPATGVFGGWPKAAAEITVLDPCCGSGHFIIAAFELMVGLRMQEESLTLADAINAVIADNLFGLELDARCTQIAAFNLGLAAWKLAGKPIELPTMHIACCGIGPQATKEEWLKLADDASEAWAGIPKHAHEFIRNGLFDLHETFSKAPELGSLIDPADRSSDLITADYETLKPFLDAVFNAETGDDEQRERAVAARGMTDAAEIIVGPDVGYTLVVTNVPYRQLDDLNADIAQYVSEHFREAKSDVGIAMAERIVSFVGDRCHSALVLPQGLLYKDYYSRLRKRNFEKRSYPLIARLGAGAFREISGEEVKVCLLISSKRRPTSLSMTHQIDATSGTPDTKADSLASSQMESSAQRAVLLSRRSVVSFGSTSNEVLLEDSASFSNGIQTGDYPRFGRCFWEIRGLNGKWALQLSTVVKSIPHGGREHVLLWENGEGQLHEFVESKLGVGKTAAWIRGLDCQGKLGVAISAMGELKATLYGGELFDDNTVVIIPNNPSDLADLWRFCSDKSYNELVRAIDQSSKVRGALLRVPFSKSCKSQGDDLPPARSADPTQWLFHGRPDYAEPATALQVGIGRLLGFRWQAELDPDMRLASEARALLNRCEELNAFTDDDGIVCLSPLRGEGSAADRLRRLLTAAFGGAWSANKEHELLQAAADEFNKGAAAGSLDEWLRDHFFIEHCKLFHNRPFIWHIWDGKKDGFHALVNYHKLAGPKGEGRRTLEALTYSYLEDWIQRQQDALNSEESGAEARLAAAMQLRDELEKILEGEPPYDIFVRWKPLHEQAIGWNPDINNGVRLNIRPFMMADDMKKKGAGVLRSKPNIKWKKDRGKEPKRPKDEYPWFWGCDPEKYHHHQEDFPGGSKFDGSRWNDLHHSNGFKQSARERAVEEVAT